jgi:hypothetical protein
VSANQTFEILPARRPTNWYQWAGIVRRGEQIVFFALRRTREEAKEAVSDYRRDSYRRN